MNRLRIVFPDDWTRSASGFAQLERLEELGDVAVYDRAPRDRAELVAWLRPAEVIVSIRARTAIDAALLDELPDLKLIAVTGTGYSHVDVEAATRRGVLVCNSPGRSSQSVAELTFALLLAATRRVATADRAMRRGEWPDPWEALVVTSSPDRRSASSASATSARSSPGSGAPLACALSRGARTSPRNARRPPARGTDRLTRSSAKRTR